MRIYSGARLQVSIFRYPHMRHFLPRRLAVAGAYDGGRRLRCGSLSWLDYQIEWTLTSVED